MGCVRHNAPFALANAGVDVRGIEFGDSTSVAVFAGVVGGLALGIPMGFWFERGILKPGGLTQERMTGTALGFAVNAYVGILYFGTFSAATTMRVPGVFGGSRTDDMNGACGVYWLSAVPQAGCWR